MDHRVLQGPHFIIIFIFFLSLFIHILRLAPGPRFLLAAIPRLGDRARKLPPAPFLWPLGSSFFLSFFFFFFLRQTDDKHRGQRIKQRQTRKAHAYLVCAQTAGRSFAARSPGPLKFNAPAAALVTIEWQ
jgi:hypothetical protein